MREAEDPKFDSRRTPKKIFFLNWLVVPTPAEQQLTQSNQNNITYLVPFIRSLTDTQDNRIFKPDYFKI